MNQHPATQASCKLSGNDRGKFLYQSRRYGFHVGRCPGCGLTFVLDRRITLAYLQLSSTQATRKALTGIGFELLRMDVVCEYNLPVTAYLESLGVPTTVRSRLAAALDWLIDRGLFFRNNMRVFCRKPLA